MVSLFLGQPLVPVLAQTAPEANKPSVVQVQPWADAPFTYSSSGKTLIEVLDDFSKTFSLRLEVAGEFTSRVSGKFDRRSPTDFLDRMAGIYGFQWFVNAGTLHISRTQDAVVKAMPISGLDSSGAIRRALSELRILNEKFGYSEVVQQGLIIVSGPPAYVRLIERTLSAWPSTPGGLQVEVFRLKYASVDDRTIIYRDREIRTPGVATVLRNLLGDTVRPSGGVSVNFSPSPNPLLPQPPAAKEESPARDSGGAGTEGTSRDRNASGGIALRPSIQSDSRINAVIVRDLPDRFPMYRALIAQLDVPSSMIEIEALIIDVNKNKLEELGIAWYGTGDSGRGSIAFGNANVAPGPNTLSLFGGPAGSQVNLTAGSSVVLPNAGQFFVARVRALEQTGDASIQARPSILTAENLGAVLDLSETFYIETTSERTALVTPVTVGTSLRVTPRLVREGERLKVRLNVDIEDGQIQAQNPVGNIPTVRRGSVSTEAALSLEDSLLIGGYSSTQMVAGRDKVPLLGDIPVFGGLFSAKNQQVQSRERLFMLRARLISMAEPSTVTQSTLPAAAPVVLPTTTPAALPAPAPAAAVASPIARAEIPPVASPVPNVSLIATPAATVPSPATVTTPPTVTEAPPKPVPSDTPPLTADVIAPVQPIALPSPPATQPKTKRPEKPAATSDASTQNSAPVTASITVSSDQKGTDSSSPAASSATINQINRRVLYRQLDAWAAAWSAGDMDQFMEFYSQSFPDRKNFESRRRGVLANATKPPTVTVQVVEAQNLGPDTTQLEFVQRYSAESSKLKTNKIQVWRLEEGRLRIIEERSRTSGR